MAYRFESGDGGVRAGLRRIAVEQLEEAIAEIDDRDLPQHETVHQVRKRCKKLRGLIRLVRPGFPAYGEENAGFRDAARGLSFLRDAEALIETYDGLMEAYGGEVERRAFASVRRRLTWRKKAASRSHDRGAALTAFRRSMVRARSRAKQWQVEGKDLAVLAGGLARTYGRARLAMEDAQAARTPERLHEWRKRVKYHWYHCRLLQPIWPAALEAQRDAAKALSGLLGDHHDLAVFAETLQAEPAAYGRAEELEVLAGLIRQRQARLEAEAFALGGRLLAEKPKALSRRWGAYWTLWRHADDRPALALAG